jgi:hypothetical protein
VVEEGQAASPSERVGSELCVLHHTVHNAYSCSGALRLRFTWLAGALCVGVGLGHAPLAPRIGNENSRRMRNLRHTHIHYGIHMYASALPLFIPQFVTHTAFTVFTTPPPHAHARRVGCAGGLTPEDG